jgi:hypothetical protein
MTSSTIPNTISYRMLPARAITPGARRSAEGALAVGRAFQTLLAMGSIGALANEGLGTAAALGLVVLFLPLLAFLVQRWADDNCLNTLMSPDRAALILPALALPGALLGWTGVILMALVALIAFAV